jgi:hypothetical protein
LRQPAASAATTSGCQARIVKNWTAKDLTALQLKQVKQPKPMKFDLFLALVKSHGLPTPQTEYRFAPPRRWRFDYCWPDRLIALEQEGGVWTRGRHSRGAGMVNDMEKYNAAQLAGWVVLRFTPQQLTSGEALPVLTDILR